MKKNISILIFLLLFSNLLAKGEILTESVVFNLENGLEVNIFEVENQKLRIQVKKNKDVEIKENKYHINKNKTKEKPVKNIYRYNLGNYMIEEEKNGYTLYNKTNEKLYTTSFSYNERDKEIIEEKYCFNEELLYGMGEADNIFPITNRYYEMFQVSDYSVQARLHIPFYFSSGGDVFYYNIKAKDTFKFRRKKESRIVFKTKRDYIDYYYFNEKNPKEIVSNFYNFSDSKSMIPKWAFGYQQSKYGYKNSKEVYDLVKKFEENKIPVSSIILDLYWFKKMGDLDWDLENWKDYKELEKHMEDRGIKLITISEPFYTNDSKNYEEFNKKGLFAKDKLGKTVKWRDWWCFGSKEGSIFNVIAEGAQEELGKKYIKMRKDGIDGFWMDLGEPERTPDHAMFNEYSEEEFHNYYNKEWVRLVYEEMMKAYPNERPFLMTRSGFTGSAKYNVSVWSGDVSTNFSSLKKQIGIELNAAISGYSFWGTDVGGFTGTERRLPDEELFVRWMQFGAFTPIFRAHGAMSPREPWIFGDKTTSIIKKYIDLRYDLLPYIYATAYQTYLDGIPMIRPLYFEHFDQEKYWKNLYEFYFGDYLLIAPITRKLSEKNKRKIYIPRGEWYDFNTFEKIESENFEKELTLEEIPVYVKGGAIIPMESNLLLVPIEEGSSFVWYDDDGISNDYLKGEYQAIEIKLNNKKVEFNNVSGSMKIIIKLLKDKVSLNKLKNVEDEGKFYRFEVNLSKGRNIIEF